MGRKDDVNVHFIGGSSENVTGSCVIVTYPKNDNTLGTIALDMGLIQGEPTIQRDYTINKQMIERIPFMEIEYVFVSHSHVDHLGNLPSLVHENNGFEGKVICTYETLQIGKKLLEDSVYIHKRNIDTMKFKGKKVKELYNKRDVYEIIDKMEAYSLNEIIKLNDNLSFRLLPNNHCLGACQIELFFKTPSNKIKKIIYTGDMGSNMNQQYRPFLNDLEQPTNANLVIMESTYGANDGREFNKKQVKQERIELKQIISEVVSQGNRVLLPSFAFNRGQELMCLIYDYFKDEEWFSNIPVIVDSKLFNTINKTYLNTLDDENLDRFSEVMSWKNFKFIDNYKTTITFLSKRVPCLILASSGFGDQGSCKEYIRNLSTYKNDMIISVGYSPQESLLSKVLNDDKVIKVDKEVLGKRCRKKRCLTFTSHISQKELINYMKQINTNKIVLHHGTKEAKENLKEIAKNELMKIGKTTPIEISKKDMIITI